ncbi:MAG: hypothetical protein VB095_07595 [Anaerovorax sp.]|nr:hypothetical protein [Anaerovorax sp.]
MPRVYLSLEQELFDLIKADAEKNNKTMNLLINNILEKIYFGSPVLDYSKAVEKLIEDTNKLTDGEFSLVEDLPSFSELCIATAENGYLQPATLRARLGKLYNAAVRNGNVPFVKRATNKKNGELKFLARAAVYVKDSKAINDIDE